MVTVLRRTLVIWVYTVVLRDQETRLTKLGNYPKIIWRFTLNVITTVALILGADLILFSICNEVYTVEPRFKS